VWYDVYVQLDGADVVAYAGERGQEMTKIVDTTTNVAGSTDRIQIAGNYRDRQRNSVGRWAVSSVGQGGG